MTERYTIEEFEDYAGFHVTVLDAKNPDDAQVVARFEPNEHLTLVECRERAERLAGDLNRAERKAEQLEHLLRALPLPPELTLRTVCRVTKEYPEFLNHPTVMEWVKHNSGTIVDWVNKRDKFWEDYCFTKKLADILRG